MKMFRKLASLVIAGAMLTSSLGFAVTASAAEVETESVAVDAHLQDKVDNGVILHAFNWSYNSIKENLPAIAAAGYSTVQTSPVQQPKNYGLSKDVAGQWWKLYQPVSVHIAQNSWLGTKADLTSLCQEADKYGIKIIADIVVNHMGNMLETDPNSVSDEVKTYEPTFYNNRSSYFHSYTGDANDGSVQAVVQGHVSACPDLNTGNSAVQTAVLNLLKECIDCGVDGFRFDAAKHIETSNDGSYASSFWNNTLGQAKSYYSQKNSGKTLFAYGEILNTPGSGRSYSSYTGLMRITDNKTGDSILNAVNSRNASGAASSAFKSGLSASNVVLWAESHDTFEGNAGSGGLTNTSSVPDSNVIKAWALVASRNNVPALFFARPGEALMGEVSSNNMYKSTAVSEVNKFHNLSVGKSEKLGSSGSIAYVARGTDGIVLVNCGSTSSSSVSVSGTGLANGTYTDTITGNSFTVSNGTVSGTIGTSGVAVVYKGSTTPKVTNSVENCSFSTDTITLKLGLENAVKGSYCLDNSTPVEFTSATNISIGSDYEVGDTINLTLTATDSKGVKETANYKYVKSRKTATGIYVWFNAKNKSSWKAPYYVYMYDEDTVSGTVYCNGTWPGQAMKYDSKSGYYYCEVPEVCVATDTATKKVTDSDFNLGTSKNTHVIISASGDQQQYPADGASASIKKQFMMDGNSKIYAKSSANSFENITLVPYVENVSATTVTKGTGSTPATTQVVTTTQRVTSAPKKYKFGDVNMDGSVTIADATAIQFMLAELGTKFTDLQNILGDVNNDGKVTIADATAIQFFLAELTGAGRTGQEYLYYEDDPNPTSPVVDDGYSMHVTAKSNYFPTYQTAFDENTKKFTVTYSLTSAKDLVNTEWYLTYDSSVLKFNNDDNLENDNWTIMPKISGAVINTKDPDDPNLISGNTSSVGNLYKISSKDGKPVDFVSFTFEILKPGYTTVDLSVRNLTLGLKDTETMILDPDSEEYAVYQNNVRDTASITYKQTNVYDGKYSEGHAVAEQIPFTTVPVVTDPSPTVPDPSGDVTEPSESTQQTEPSPKTSFLLTDNLGWGQAYIYAWDADGNALCGEWPGAAQAETVTNGFGETQFIIQIPEGAVGVIANNGTQQTADITDFTYDGYWIDGTQNELGHYNVQGFMLDPQPSSGDEPTTHGGGDSSQIILTDNLGWGVAYIYAWDADGNALCGDWPGEGQAETITNDLGETQFVIHIPEGAVGVIANNGSQQTADITDFTPDGYWIDGTQNELGHYNVQPWYYDQPGPDPGPGPEPSGDIKFTNNAGWGSVFLYAWDADGNSLLGDWPGTPMESIGNNDFGEPVFSAGVPAGAVGLVFNAGMNGDQSVDVTPGVEGYYSKGDRDGAGHLNLYAWGDPGSGPDPGPGPDPSGDTREILFTSNWGWSDVHCYWWNGESNNGWPGTAMEYAGTNDYGETQYKVSVPTNITNLIFSGSGSQTVDLAYDANATGWYLTGWSDGKATCGTW